MESNPHPHLHANSFFLKLDNGDFPKLLVLQVACIPNLDSLFPRGFAAIDNHAAFAANDFAERNFTTFGVDYPGKTTTEWARKGFFH